MSQAANPSQGTKKSVAEHIRSLHGRMGQLEKEMKSLQESLQSTVEQVVARSLPTPAGPGPSTSDSFDGIPPLDRDVLAHVVELENRLKQVEDENRELVEMCNELRSQNEAISNMYVAKHRLHASLDAGEILQIVTEILNELVGCEEFAILFLEQKTGILRRVSGRGEAGAVETVPLGEGLLGRVATSGQAFFFDSEGDAKPPQGVPLAVLPLRAEDKTIGVIAVYRLLPHKDDFTPVDTQLLQLVAEHTPSALMSARLHRLSKSRKA